MEAVSRWSPQTNSPSPSATRCLGCRGGRWSGWFYGLPESYRLISLDVSRMPRQRRLPCVLMPPRPQRSEAPTPTPSGGSATHVRSDPVYVLKAQLFRVLGHPVRIRILELLSEGERTVGDLQAELSLELQRHFPAPCRATPAGGSGEPASRHQRLLRHPRPTRIPATRSRKTDPDLGAHELAHPPQRPRRRANPPRALLKAHARGAAAAAPPTLELEPRRPASRRPQPRQRSRTKSTWQYS